MGVLQINKHKVRPVMEYCELNTYVDTYMGTVDMCTEKLKMETAGCEHIHCGPQESIPAGSCCEISVAILLCLRESDRV